MKLRLTFAATTALFTLTALASAQEQPWLKDRRYGEGIGLRSGNLEFHPGVAAEVGYDSNYFQRDEREGAVDGEGGLRVEDAWRLRVTPSLSMSTLSQRRRGEGAPPPPLQFQARLFASYNEFFGSEDISAQRRLDYGAGFRADIGPQRRFGADVSVDYLRTGEPSNAADVDAAFDRGTVSGGAGVSWRPGGGLFDWRLGYAANYNYFEDRGFETLDNVEHGPATRGRWRFLPRTALLYDARYMMVRYLNETTQPDGDYVEARVGVSGLFTTRFAFLALLGWNSSYYEAVGDEPSQNYDGFVAHGELKWFLLAPVREDSAQTGLSSIAAGYMRNFSNSYLGSFYVRDRGYGTFEYFLGGMFMASLTGGISRVSFPAVGDQPAFAQNRFDVKVYAEYRTSDVFALNASVMYDQVLMPDGRLEVVSGTQEDLEFSRFQAYLGARLFW
jgi:hypothetical protein